MDTICVNVNLVSCFVNQKPDTKNAYTIFVSEIEIYLCRLDDVVCYCWTLDKKRKAGIGVS